MAKRNATHVVHGDADVAAHGVARTQLWLPERWQTQSARRRVESLAVLAGAVVPQPPVCRESWVWDIHRCACSVIEHAGRIVAFANVLQAGLQELSIDLMRYTDDAPHGLMDGLIVNLMLWGKERGYQRFNLGMAPLSGLYERPLSPLWHKAGLALHTYGQSYYNFEGLRRFKEKYHPVWMPRYLASPGGLAVPRVLLDTTTLIAGGVKSLVAK